MLVGCQYLTLPLKTKQIRNMAINPVAFSLRLADPCKLISVASCGLRVSRTKVNALLSPTFVSKPALSASCGSAAPPAVEPLLLTCYPWCVVCAGAPQVRGVRSCVVCAAAWCAQLRHGLTLAWPGPNRYRNRDPTTHLSVTPRGQGKNRQERIVFNASPRACWPGCL
jgi:hypothetical protein